eukprot:gene7265-5111_t
MPSGVEREPTPSPSQRPSCRSAAEGAANQLEGESGAPHTSPAGAAPHLVSPPAGLEEEVGWGTREGCCEWLIAILSLLTCELVGTYLYLVSESPRREGKLAKTQTVQKAPKVPHFYSDTCVSLTQRGESFGPLGGRNNTSAPRQNAVCAVEQGWGGRNKRMERKSETRSLPRLVDHRKGDTEVDRVNEPGGLTTEWHHIRKLYYYYLLYIYIYIYLLFLCVEMKRVVSLEVYRLLRLSSRSDRTYHLTN